MVVAFDSSSALAASPPGSPAQALLLALGRGLHESGFPAPMLERALGRVADHLGVEAQFFSTPTSIFSAFGAGTEQRVHLARVEPASVDLGRLVELQALIDALCQDAMGAAAAIREVERIVGAKPPFRSSVTVAAYALSSGAFAAFFGGGAHELVASAAIGMVTGALAVLGRRVVALARVFELAAAACAALLAVIAAHVWPPLSVFTTTLAGLIILIPGFTLTIALTELATRHLASGTARLAGAMVTFLTIGFGVALGSRVGEALLGAVEPGATTGTVDGVTELVALVLAPASMVVLLRAPPRELPWLIVTGMLGFFGARLGATWLSPQLGMFVGALALGAASNAYAWLRRRPGSTVLVPGILMLVPGSMGYRGLSEMMAREVLPGIATAVEMVLVAVSLVAGLLAANVVTPPAGARPSRRRPEDPPTGP